MDTRKRWFRLDNAAKVFPPVRSRHFTTVFRLAVVLEEAVRLPDLQAALEAVLPRFPVFRVHLKKGAFWYYLEENRERPLVHPETRHPCMWRPRGGSGEFPFRVKAYGHRISLEVAHMITDGSGARSFLLALLGDYLRRRRAGTAVGSRGEGAEDPGSASPEELEDSFLRAFDPDVPAMPSPPRAYHLPVPLSPRGAYYTVTGLLPAGRLREEARSWGVSVTEYVLAQLFASYQELALKSRPRRPIRVLVPVDLRRFYGSRTLRNFFVFLEPEIDLRLGTYDFEELIRRAHHFMRLNTTRKVLSRYISRNVRPEASVLLRLVPRGVKDLVLSYAHQRYGERSNTGSLSNLGRVELPAEFRREVRHFEFFPIPSRRTRVNCAMISHEEHTAISFGKMTEDRSLERIFFRRLRHREIPVRIWTNQPHESGTVRAAGRE